MKLWKNIASIGVMAAAAGAITLGAAGMASASTGTQVGIYSTWDDCVNSAAFLQAAYPNNTFECLGASNGDKILYVLVEH